MSDKDELLITVEDYEEAAKKILPKMAYDYFRSGADDERTLEANRRAFKRYEIWYRVLVDVSEVDLSADVLGTSIAFPVLVAPTAFHRLAHPDGEVATARGAAEAGTIYTLSTLATRTIEDVAAAPKGPKWFQLYVLKDRGQTKSLAERAEAAGFGAILVTVDTAVLGRRIRDLRNAFALPEGMSMVNIEEMGGSDVDAGASALADHVAFRHDPSLNWNDIEWLRSITNLPVLLKGIVRGDDAARAVENGASGIVVSNHGGRQMDSAPGTLDALPEVLEAVGGRCEVLMDGGIRGGTDVLKALALGAKAVLVGRPALWGLAVGGADGVRSVLELLRDELSSAMALAGCPNISSIDSTLVRRRFSR